MSLARALHRSLFNRQHLPLLAGICVGIVLSLMTAPVANDGCRRDNRIAADPGWGGQVIDRSVLQPSAGAPSIAVKAGTQKVEEDYSDYEPRINLAGKPQSAKKEPQALIRPRYFSTELGIKEKCFVAILSSLKQIPTLGLAINKTIAHHINR
jgi:chondroitin polymerizing factor